MKKLLISILIILLVILSGFLIISGIGLGGLKILGISGIKSETEKLDEQIQEAGKLAEKDFKQAVSDVETNAKKLTEEKKRYESMITTSEDGTITTGQIEKYEIEALWVMLGKHATSEGVELQMDVVKSGAGEDSYNLKFKATGSYISIIDFISSIENDSALGFKIEEFKMNGSGEKLQATCVCKDITIKDISETTPTNNQNDQDQNDQNDQNTNTGNTSNTKNNTNTGNTTTNNNIATNTNVAQ